MQSTDQLHQPQLDGAPRVGEVDGGHGHAVGRHGKAVEVVAVRDGGVQEHPLGGAVVPVGGGTGRAGGGAAGELGDVGVELVQVRRLEG